MKIKWYGHSCFMLSNESGQRILTDPVDTDTGYKLSEIQADIVTISHPHHDHNYMSAVTGSPIVINTVGKHSPMGVSIVGFPTYHDDVCGKKRGENIMFRYELDSIRVLHAGDLGEIPSEDILNAVGTIDVLLVPIGGVYTINHEGARALANRLAPKVVIPMHYKTPALTFELEPVNDFLSSARNCKIHKLNQCEATLTIESLGEDRILVLDYCDKE